MDSEQTPSTDSITIHAEFVETDTHLYQAVVVHTGDPPVRDLHLEQESIEESSLSSEEVHNEFRELVETGNVDITVYQPGVFESSIHAGLQRLSHFLVILSTPIEANTATNEDKNSLRTATDSIRYSWIRAHGSGFEVRIMKYRQGNILPLLEEITDELLEEFNRKPE